MLNSFIVSTTPFKAVGWGADEKAEFERRNVLFQVDDKNTYVRSLFDTVLGAAATVG